ncbi:MAG: class I SAM-dependent methyltransferase [Planctomycetes bacterium]|nr:class I SAM-dependent methyltransferase [Planctomycetota bacterium]
MLQRILEPEVMDSAQEALDYDQMDHAPVNRVFVADFLAKGREFLAVLDVGAGTAQIPIELCHRHPCVQVVAIDLAEEMLSVGRVNVERAGLAQRIQLQRCDAKRMPFEDASFDAVISNSIVHHIPEPSTVFAEMVRVVKSDGLLFVRDLLRPVNDGTLRTLVETYAAGANAHQKQMFGDSLHAALTLDEVRDLVSRLGFPAESVRATSDRHWTWAALKPRAV